MWLRIQAFCSGNFNARGHMSDVNEATRQDNIKTEVGDTV